MRIYYIKDDTCVDVNKKMANMGNNVIRVAPFIGGALVVGQVACKFALMNAAMYGSLKFGEFIGSFPVGMADEAYSKLYHIVVNVVK